MPEFSPQFIGRWQGTNTLYLDWPSKGEFESPTRLEVAAILEQRFFEFHYDWQHEGKTHQGVVLIGEDLKPGALCATWRDSWHQSDIMSCCGNAEGPDDLSINGSYLADDDGPEWHWRIHWQLLNADALRLRMYNISPEGAESLAVAADFARQAA
ncbi:MAG: DUF1579 domain-containing protein [Xanthomonadales bacterium]|jgi:hypothetical protein|nr:DUF1579 domain-containing protein [Xanthomonadales bacterium]